MVTVMSDTANLQDFIRFDALLEATMEDPSKDDFAECARLLALNLAHYQAKCGDLPLEEREKPLETQTIDATTRRLLAQGTLQMLVALAPGHGEGG